MYKRIFIYLLVAAAIAAVFFLYFKLTQQDTEYTSSYTAVPNNCALVLEIGKNYSEAQGSALLSQLAANDNSLGEISFNPLKEWPEIIDELQKLKGYQPEWKSLLTNSTIVFANTDQLRADAWIMSIGLKKETSASHLEEMIYSWHPDIKLTKRDFKGTTIYQTEKRMYSLINDCMVVASTPSLIEDAIIQNQKNNVMTNNASFNNARDVMSVDSPFHLFASLDKGGWLQLDRATRNNQWMLSGYLITSDTTLHTLELCDNGQKFKVAAQLPAKTSILDVYSYTDFDTGWQMHEQHYGRTNSAKYWSQAWQDFGDSCSCDLSEAMLSWRTGEWGSAVIATSDSTTAEVLFYGVKDTIKVMEKFAPLLLPQNKSFANIYQLKYPQLFDRNKTQTFLVEASYATQKGNYVFVASSPYDLLALNDTSKTLAQDNRFMKSVSTIDTESGRFVYQTDYYTSPLPTTILSFLKGMPYIAINAEPFRENQYLINIALPIENSAKASENANAPEETPTNTTLAEEQDIVTSSWQVINHSTKEKETLFQNSKNELCLKGADGKILWRKPTNKIVGDVTQIDALKNGKLQYAFATEGGVEIIDRNGKSLSGFPFSPKPSMCSGLFVFDYDGNKNYRLIFADELPELWNKTVQGKDTEGWKYKGTAPIAQVAHIKVNKEDILVAITHSGTAQALKRNGEIKTENTAALLDWNKQSVSLTETGGNIQINYTKADNSAASIVLALK
jgi:hypothetical protein